MLVTQLCLTLCYPKDYSLPGSSVHGILRARILEWVAIPFSKWSSQFRDLGLLHCKWIFYCLCHHWTEQLADFGEAYVFLFTAVPARLSYLLPDHSLTLLPSTQALVWGLEHTWCLDTVKFLQQIPYKKGLKEGIYLSGWASSHKNFYFKKEGSDHIGQIGFISWADLGQHFNEKRCISCFSSWFTNLFCLKACSLKPSHNNHENYIVLIEFSTLIKSLSRIFLKELYPYVYTHIYTEFPRWLSGTEYVCQCMTLGSNPWVGKISWRRRWLPTAVFLPRKSHGQRSLVGYSSWSCKRVVHNLATTQQQRIYIYIYE